MFLTPQSLSTCLSYSLLCLRRYPAKYSIGSLGLSRARLARPWKHFGLKYHRRWRKEGEILVSQNIMILHTCRRMGTTVWSRYCLVGRLARSCLCFLCSPDLTPLSWSVSRGLLTAVPAPASPSTAGLRDMIAAAASSWSSTLPPQHSDLNTLISTLWSQHFLLNTLISTPALPSRFPQLIKLLQYIVCDVS